MKDELVPAWAAGAIAKAAKAAAPTATAEARVMRWIEDMSQLPLSSGPLLAHPARRAPGTAALASADPARSTTVCTGAMGRWFEFVTVSNQKLLSLYPDLAQARCRRASPVPDSVVPSH